MSIDQNHQLSFGGRIVLHSSHPESPEASGQPCAVWTTPKLTIILPLASFEDLRRKEPLLLSTKPSTRLSTKLFTRRSAKRSTRRWTKRTSKHTSRNITGQGRRINSSLREIATLPLRPSKQSESEGSDGNKDMSGGGGGAAAQHLVPPPPSGLPAFCHT